MNAFKNLSPQIIDIAIVGGDIPTGLTGIPVTKINQSENERLKLMENILLPFAHIFNELTHIIHFTAVGSINFVKHKNKKLI